MIVVLLFILNKINYFALPCLLVTFLLHDGLKEVQVPLSCSRVVYLATELW